MAEFFATSKKNVSHHNISALEDNELREISVVKYYLTTAPYGKNYQVAFYSSKMILAMGFRVRSPNGLSSASGRSKTLRNLCARGLSLTLLPGGLPIKGKSFHGQQIFLPRMPRAFRIEQGNPAACNCRFQVVVQKKIPIFQFHFGQHFSDRKLAVTDQADKLTNRFIWGVNLSDTCLVLVG